MFILEVPSCSLHVQVMKKNVLILEEDDDDENNNTTLSHHVGYKKTTSLSLLTVKQKALLKFLRHIIRIWHPIARFEPQITV